MMIVTKFPRSCCGQATVGGNSSKPGRPLPASMAGRSNGRAISLDDIDGVESRAHQSPAILRYAILRSEVRGHYSMKRREFIALLGGREDWRQAHHARGTERKTSDPHFSQR
jgi:hypothetical protein